MKSTSRSKRLRSVFQSDRPSNMNARIAQLCVLYEDLRLELAELETCYRTTMASPSSECRTMYFFRRSIATLQEFSDAIVGLDGLPEFQPVLTSIVPEHQAVWRESVDFFKQHKHSISNVRNDVGGHFGLEAARYAIKSFEDDVVGTFEVMDTQVRGAIAKDGRLWFAAEIVNSGTFTSLLGNPSTASWRDKYIPFLKILSGGYQKAWSAIAVVAVGYLWNRFG